MSFAFQFKRKARVAGLLLAAGLLAPGQGGAQSYATPSVETYTNSAAPVDAPSSLSTTGQPVRSGAITLQDVLKAHPATRPPALLPPTPLLQPSATIAPVLTPPTKESSTSLMMMQGMKTVLQQAGANAPPQPPQLGGHGNAGGPVDPTAAAAANAAFLPPAQQPPPAAGGLQYQPGQAPRTLDGGLAAPMPAITPTGSTTTTVTEITQTTPAGATPDCTPSATSWTKTCAEAGYPASYAGAIHGETRTTCPDQTLTDVWVSNTCASPDGDTTQPLSAPTVVSPSVPPASSASSVAGAASPAAAFDPTIRNDASCGPANGLAANFRPNGNLCNSGRATEINGDGPWRWSCQGSLGGMTVSCAAPLAPGAVSASAATSAAATPAPAAPVVEDGLCGSANNAASSAPPATGLCLKGAASHVNGDGPWTWACSGMNGGSAAACSSSKQTDGICGPASGDTAGSMPMADLCTAGLASAVTGSGPWNWTCSGLYGGNAATCTAAPKQNAVCGAASVTGQRATPIADLCSIGAASTVQGNGPWSWTCAGTHGGATVSCDAPVAVSGQCGSANGVAVSQAPNDNLCLRGKPSRLSGMGPWLWNCGGSDGGDTESCTAPLETARMMAIAAASQPSGPVTSSEVPAAAPVAAVEKPVPETPRAALTRKTTVANMCGSAAELAAIAAPDKNLCRNGKAGEVTGDGPWSWTCHDEDGHRADCATLSPLGSDDDATATPPVPAMPADAMPPAQQTAPPAYTPPVSDGKAACGPVNGQDVAHAPAEDLCAIGKPSLVKGKGPWEWSCIKGKSKTSCSANKEIVGECGPANGSIRPSSPNTGLCSFGTPTEVHGTGPWLWSCVGTGGGGTTSCSASAQSTTKVDGNCGAASNAPMTATPAANLCDSGMASTVYGEGPWTWTCSGLNGGIAASCTAQRDIPAAPPPPGPPVNGLCGSANGEAAIAAPADNLCTTGVATSLSGQGPWNWNCLAANGGTTVSCTAPLQPPAPITGICGSANGVPTLTTPRGGLCAAGISSAVSGQGPWTWSCSGTNGGGAVGCVGPLAGTSGGSLPGLVTPPMADEPAAPQAAPAAPVRRSGNAGGAGGSANSSVLITPKLSGRNTPPPAAMAPMHVTSAPDIPRSTSAALPPPPSFGDEQGYQPPADTPPLPDDAQPLQPPPIRDTIQPSKALRTGLDTEGNLLPGNHFTLNSDISVIPFNHAAENFDAAVVPTLDQLAATLQANGGVRITLTAYADVSGGTTPREARRLSLTRALGIRDYLTAKGISSSRIDVRALGANVPSGNPDRVDVKAN